MSCIRISIVVCLLAVGISYLYGPEKVLNQIEKRIPKELLPWLHASQPEPQRQEAETSQPSIFTKEELWKYYRGGAGSKGLYLAFLGKVYDVSDGKQYYQPGGGYDFFAGRDGTKGFVTGDFSDEGLTDILDGLDDSAYGGFEEWTSFYATTYKYVGTVVGNFYDDKGQSTQALKDVEKKIELSMKAQEAHKADMQKHPLCNTESSVSKGSRVWCSTKSGGVERDWVGVPRLYHAPGAAQARCACIKDKGQPTEGKDTGSNRGDLDNPKIKEYDNCKPDSPSCVTKPPK